MSDTRADPYEALGVARTADTATIRQAYRKLVLQLHPDRIMGEETKAANTTKFIEVQQAYQILSDPKSKERYDDEERLRELRRQRYQRVEGEEVAHLRSPDQLVKHFRQPQDMPPPARSAGVSTLFEDQPWEGEPPDRQPYEMEDRRPGEKPVSQTKAAYLSSSPRVSRNTGTYLAVEGVINQTAVQALPDTGADLNFMTLAMAVKLRLKLDHFARSKRPSFVMGNGRPIFALAQTVASWRFRYGPRVEYETTFHVLQDSIFDVMMGAEFLFQTETMDLHRERLTRLPRPGKALHIRFVNLCGRPSRRLVGHVGQKQCYALPDSGAEPNLLSYQFARDQGWLLDMFPGPASCRLLQFADGSMEQTEGRLKLRWTFKKTLPGEFSPVMVEAIFDVLRDCPFDVILGQDFLDQTQAFELHKASFMEIMVDGSTGLNTVMWAPTLPSRILRGVKQKLGQGEKPEHRINHGKHQVDSRPDASINSNSDSDEDLAHFADEEYRRRRPTKPASNSSATSNNTSTSTLSSGAQTNRQSRSSSVPGLDHGGRGRRTSLDQTSTSTYVSDASLRLSPMAAVADIVPPKRPGLPRARQPSQLKNEC